MNKLTIPALLLGVVMIAGAFAFMPVQEASTVHTSTAGSPTQLTKVTAALVTGDVVDFATAETTLTCPNGCIVQDIKVTIVTATGAAILAVAASAITVDGQTVNHEAFAHGAGGADITEVSMFHGSDAAANISDTVDNVNYLVADTTVVIAWDETVAANAAGDTLLVDFYIETAIGGTAASAVTA